MGQDSRETEPCSLEPISKGCYDRGVDTGIAPLNKMPDFTTETPALQVLDWVNQQLDELFGMGNQPVKSFQWESNVYGKPKWDRWAGWYSPSYSAIYLNPEFFSGLGAKEQSEAIENALLHEMCHHVQREIYGDGVPSHGKEFRKLAYFVNGKRGRDAVQVYHSLAKTPEGKEAEKAQKKALAILALTTSSNEHEAALAAAKYAQFTAQNNIVLDAYGQALSTGLPELVKEHVWTSKVKSTWLSTVLSAVAYTQGCVYTYIRDSACTRFHFYGRPNKISQSYDLIDYLAEAIERVVSKAKQEAKGEAPKGKSYWGAFREGVATRVASSLYGDHKRRMEEGLVASNGVSHVPGLVLKSSFDKERKASEEFLAQLHPRLGKGYSGAGSRSAAGRSAGYAAGGAISTARQTTGSSQRSLAGC